MLESIIGSWLDDNLYSNKEIFNKYKRHTIKELQHKGIDITLISPVIFGDDKTHVIDEKAAIRYAKGNIDEESLQSFAFELDYFMDSNLKEGWLFGNKYSETEYYLILWIWADIPEIKKEKYKNYDYQKITQSNIQKIEGLLLNKEIMRNYATDKGISPRLFKELRRKLEEENIRYDDNARVVVSKKLAEEPMNLIVPKDKLISMATSHFTQEKNKVTQLHSISEENYSELIIKNDFQDIDYFIDEIIKKTKSGIKTIVFSKKIKSIEELLVQKIGRKEFDLVTKEAVLLVLHKLNSNSKVRDSKYIDGNISRVLKEEKDFNWSQFEIEHADIKSNIRVTAGAGTGKTRTMLQRIMFNLKKSNGLKLKDIAMVTFTNEAADEMKKKLRALLLARFKYTRNRNYLYLLENASEITIKTIDSFSKDIIKSLGYREGYGQGVRITSMKYRRYEILREVIKNSFTKEITDILIKSEEKYYKIIEYIDSMWQELLSKGFRADQLLNYELNSSFDKTIAKIIVQANETLVAEKKENDWLEMTDLKFYSESLVETKESDIDLNINYKYVFIDEFQDTDDMQISLFVNLQKLWDAKLFIVGDEKQSIYRFRGSDNLAFDRIEKELEFKKFTMKINYRTDQKLLESMANYFNKMQGISSNSLVSFNNPNKNSAVNLVNYNTNNFEKEFLTIFQEYSSLADQEKDSVLAVLCRQNYQVDEISKLLDNNGFKGKYKTSKQGGLFQSKAAADLFGFISVLIYPTNEQNKYFVTNTPYFFNGQSMSNSIVEWNTSRIFFTEKQIEILDSILENVRIKPFLSILREIILEESFTSNIMTRLYQEGIQKDEDILRIKEEYFLDLNDILEQIAKSFGSGTYSLIDIYYWLEIKIRTDVDTSRTDTKKTNANIIITTIHKSKGLEYDWVILPKTEDRIYVRSKSLILKDDKSGFSMNLYKDEDQSNSFKKLKNIETTELKKDETRLLYVGMTRAKHELSILLPSRVKKVLSLAQIIEEARG